MENNIEQIPFPIIAEIKAQLAHIEEQNLVIQAMIADDQVARMSTDYLDLEQAQKLLHCKASTLERLRAKGLLSFFQYGRKILIKRSDIDSFLEAHRKNDDFLARLQAERDSSLFEQGGSEDGMEE